MRIIYYFQIKYQNLNPVYTQMDPISNRIMYNRIGFYFFGREFCPVFFYTVVDIRWTTRLRHYKLQRLWSHTEVENDGGGCQRSKNNNAKEEEAPSLWMGATWYSPHHDTMTWHHSLPWRDYLISLITFCVISLPWHQSNNLFIGIWFANNQDSRIRQLLII